MTGETRYWAFLSYSHDDEARAKWLHHALETYAVPSRLVGRASMMGPTPRRLHPVFRDRAELAADPDLRARIQEALTQSAFLIVVCSPAAAKSPWVDEEIRRFKALYGETRVLALIVDGQPMASLMAGREDQECFPPALRAGAGPTAGAVELIAADLRRGRDGPRLALLKLVAGMLGIGLGDLVRRDVQRRNRRMAIVAGVSMAIALIMGALALTALAAAREARAQRNQAEGLVEFMLGDLRKRLEPLGHLDLLDSVGARMMAYFGSDPDGRLDDKSLGLRARVQHMLGDIQEKRGNLGRALVEFKLAAATTAELLARKPDDAERIFNHAQSVYYVGNLALERGDTAQALYDFRQYSALAEHLVRIDPKNADWQAEVSDADTGLGTLLLKQHRAGEALRAFDRALAIDEALARGAPHDHDTALDLAQAHAFVSDAELALGRAQAAVDDRLAERAIYLRLIDADTGDIAAGQDLLVNRIALAWVYHRIGRTPEAVDELTAASRSAERLMAADRDDSRLQGFAVSAFTALGQEELRQGSLPAARTAADRATVLAETLVRRDQTVTDWKGIRLGRARLLRIEIATTASATPQACRAALALAPAEFARLQTLAAAQRADTPLEAVTAEAGLLAGDFEAASGRWPRAHQDWKSARDLLGPSTQEEPVHDRIGAIRRQLQQRETASASPKSNAAPCVSPGMGLHATTAGISYAF